MPNKESRVNADNKVAGTNPQNVTTVKTMGSTPKAAIVKVGLKETAMSPPPVPPVTAEADGTELLGSLTTQQQQRTSARVIKKLMLEPQVEREKRDTECETPIKVEEKELNFPTVRQRMPKALWSADEKSFFFEALNEYGKDFDAVTAYICAKMKKKGMPDLNMKTKTQVSHFYYRTWHKLSKYIQFEENVKKVSQELYALINYGELRKKLVSVNEKTCSRLGELVLCGSMMVRHRGRNVRVRTPMCRALRKLNQITEGASGARVCGRAHVLLRARSVGAWTRVQAVAHNPRAALVAPLRTSLATLIRALARRWSAHPSKKKKSPENNETKSNEDNMQKSIEETPMSEAQGKTITENGEEKNDLEGHLNLKPDRIFHQESKLPKKPVLHLGPRPDAEIHLPVISPSEPLSSQKICFNSYLERMRGKDIREKIRTPKRQRKDSTTDKDKENESKKPKIEETEKLLCIDDVAIDGIELMASYKNSQEDEVQASTEDEKEIKSEETADEAIDPPERDRDISEIDKDMSEREKDSFSEMEDDEKFNKSDTDNESDQGKINKGPKEQIFRNLKVKFRIRPKKRGGNIYTVVTEKDLDESKAEEVKIEGSKVEDSKVHEHKEEESKPDEDIETAIKQIRRGWSVYDSGDLTIGDLYLMFGSRSKLELDYWWAEATPPYHPHRDGKDRQRLEPGTDETDADLFSPKTVLGQDSNDDIPSGDEKKGEHVASPENKLPSSGSATFRLTSKLINRPLPPAPSTTEPGFKQLTERLKRLLSMVGNPHVAATNVARCDCGHVCSSQKKPKQQVAGSYPAPNEAPLFRHPTPIAPKGQLEPMCPELNLSSVPRWRRGRPRADQRVVVQRLLPLLPKLPPPSNLIPVNIVGSSNTPGHPQPTRILPKPTPSSAHDSPYFYAMSESNDQLFVHDGNRKIPLRPNEESKQQNKEDSSKAMHDNKTGDNSDSKKSDLKTVPSTSTRSTDRQTESEEGGEFLTTESMSLSPSRLLRDADGWLEGSVHDFSLSSFLGHLEGRPHQDQVDSQLQSLLAESSIDYVAKFADLAANVDTLVADDDLN